MPYTESLAEAVGRGIKVFPVASSESDDQAEAVFRQMAAATGARFVFLAGGADGAATGAHTDIATTGRVARRAAGRRRAGTRAG